MLKTLFSIYLLDNRENSSNFAPQFFNHESFQIHAGHSFDGFGP